MGRRRRSARKRSGRAERSRLGRLLATTARLRWRRTWRFLCGLHPVVWAILALAALAAVNYAYQAVRKPTEVLALVAPTSAKTPSQTWDAYGPLFLEHSTEIMRPELLAALVQAESSGDPLARTYWRWRWVARLFDIYAPASSAVGVLQITDGTFAEARQYCIHDHQVARTGSWLDPRTCWFNSLYFRAVPSHAIEMTSARLHQVVVEILAAQRIRGAAPAEKQRLAVVVHLCGRERGTAFAARGLRVLPAERCGDHDLRAYLARVEELSAEFARLGSRR
jgi:hypothetical protein